MLPSFFDYPGRAESSDSQELVFLSNWGNTQWQKLLKFTEIRHFKKGEVVIRHGDNDRALYIIVEGRLEVLVPSGDRKTLRGTQIREAGTVIGEQAFLDGKPRSATLRARSDGEMLSISQDGFQTFTAYEPALARDVLLDLARTLSVKLRQANEFIAGRIS